MKRIYGITDNHANAVGWYRGAGVIDFDILDFYRWVEFRKCALAYMIRPWNNQHSIARQVAYLSNVPVWVDYDDDFLNIPNHNPALEGFLAKEPAFRDYVKKFIDSADFLSFSTARLCEKYGGKKGRVIRNMLSEDLGDFMPMGKKKIIMWRGSKTHRRDLAMFEENIVNLKRLYPEWIWVFIGDKPEWLPKIEKQHIPEMDIMLYFSALKSLNPSIIVVPLEDNEFNRCKSDIAFIEGTWAGALSVVPDWEEWRHPGTFRYDTPRGFVDAVIKVIEAKEQPDEGALYHAQAKRYIQENRMLSLEAERGKILKEVFK